MTPSRPDPADVAALCLLVCAVIVLISQVIK